MPVQQYIAKVAEHSLLQGKYQWITFELIKPNELEFLAGQYIMLTVPGMMQKRSYSIASAPAVKHQFDLLVDVSPQGDGSLYLQSLNPGEEVQFMAPAGQFYMADNPEEERLAFVATGSGISAVRSMILDRLQTHQDKRPMTLHWGMRFAEDLFWEEDFRRLENEFENFRFDLVLSKAPASWPLCTGRVTDCLAKEYPDFGKTGFYLCGNTPMIQSTLELLTGRGVSPERIHHEKFY